MNVWDWLDVAAEREPACVDRVATLKALRAEKPEVAEEAANQCLDALWTALEG